MATIKETHETALVELMDEILVKTNKTLDSVVAEMKGNKKIQNPAKAAISWLFSMAMRRDGYELEMQLRKYLKDDHINTVLRKWSRKHNVIVPLA